MYFGEPMHFDGDPDDDDSIIEEKVWLVRQTIQRHDQPGSEGAERACFL